MKARKARIIVPTVVGARREVQSLRKIEILARHKMIEAFPEDTVPRYLLRDRDSIYGEEFRHRVKGMSIEEVITAPHSPWQNPYAERLIGGIRRECLDHLIIINEGHLRRVMRDYFAYYHHL
jgi:putative transposase